MTSKVDRVVISYLKNHKYSQTETAPEAVSVLSESELQKLIQETIQTYYRSYIEQWLRALDFEQLLVISNYVVDQFNESKEDQQALIEELANLKNRFLKSIKEVALSPKNSITDTVFNHFKANPTSDAEEVEDYIKSFLIDIKNNTKRQVKKWKGAV